MDLEFEWDERKAAKNQFKHGVLFEEAMTVFRDPFARIEPDELHSVEERRDAIYGYSSHGRLLIVCYTERGPNLVRIISARLLTRNERQRYEAFWGH